MFLYNLQWQWNLSSQIKPDGFIFHSIGVDQLNALKRKLPAEFPEIKMFDPNLFFWNLEYDTCGRACRNIASYDFVPIDVPSYDRKQYRKIKQWLEESVGPFIRTKWPPKINNIDEKTACITACLKFQSDFGVSRLIVPTPHISDPSDDLSDFLEWLDLGLAVAEEYSIPALISFSILDTCVSMHFDTILDQFTARKNVNGIYVVIENSREGIKTTDREIALALLDVSYLVGKKNSREVYINFADIFGLTCLSAGATAFASGYELKAKQLDFGKYIEKKSGGGAFPKFFSLTTTKMYRIIKDLNKIRDKRLLRMLESDKTEASSPLFTALESGQDANSIPSWRESKNNLKAARTHLIERLKKASGLLNSMPVFEDKINWALNWLLEAESLNSYFDSRFENDKLEAEGGNVRVWRSAFEDFIKKYNII